MNDNVTNSENITVSVKHGDDITAIASPRPWRIAEGWHEAIVDEGNNVVASGSNAANAALIVDAVNQYDEVAMQNTDFNGGRQYASLAQARREERYRKNLVKEAQELREERDRLRDIVRRMIPLVEVAQKHAEAEGAAIKGLCSLKGVDSHVVDSVQADIAALVREARAAIGKDEK